MSARIRVVIVRTCLYSASSKLLLLEMSKEDINIRVPTIRILLLAWWGRAKISNTFAPRWSIRRQNPMIDIVFPLYILYRNHRGKRREQKKRFMCAQPSGISELGINLLLGAVCISLFYWLNLTTSFSVSWILAACKHFASRPAGHGCSSLVRYSVYRLVNHQAVAGVWVAYGSWSSLCELALAVSSHRRRGDDGRAFSFFCSRPERC